MSKFSEPIKEDSSSDKTENKNIPDSCISQGDQQPTLHQNLGS